MASQKGKISKRSVEAVPVPSSGTNVLHDNELAGFHVRVYPTGRRAYLFNYRYQGQERRPKLGDHGPMTADQARTEALRLASLVAQRIDPVVAAPKPTVSPTLDDVFKRFTEWSADVHKPRYRELNNYLYRASLAGELGHRRLTEIGKSDVERLRARLAGNATKANQTITLLKLLFNRAAEWEMFDGRNPATSMKRLAEGRHEKYLRQDQYDRLYEVLNRYEASNLAPKSALDAIRLLALTGARRGEALALTWGEVGQKELILQDSKTGRKRVPLMQAAQDLLASLPRGKDHELVFRGPRSGGEIKNIENVWRKVRADAGLDEFRLHDLRHSFASAAVSGGVQLTTVGHLLGHKDLRTTQRYAHLADRHIQDALNGINGAIAPKQTVAPTTRGRDT